MLNKTILAAIYLILFSHSSNAQTFPEQLSLAAIERTQHPIVYDGRYQKIAYPGGDVEAGIGVCTDVIIRSYRKLGIDLQQLVHEDIRQHFTLYPSKRIWGQNKPDTNIDHRRVPNLQTFFTRNGQSLSLSNKPEDYLPGDLVTWMLPGNLPHIGIVVNQNDSISGNPLIVHNIGSGPKMDDNLFSFTITGHYRFAPKELPNEQL